MLEIPFLDGEFLGNPTSRWIYAAGVALGLIVVLRVVARVGVGRFRKLAKRTANTVDDLAADLLEKTKLLFILLLAFWVASNLLVLSARVEGYARTVLVIGLLLQLAIWGSAGVTFALDRYRERQREVDPGGATAVGALGFVARVGVWSVVALLALDNLGIDITALVTGLGVSGIAMALAVQNILKDLFSSLSIVLDKPFVIGDFIVVGEFSGTVEHVGLKTTRIRSLTGEQLVFSNSDLLESRIRNYRRMEERRATFAFGVTYDTDDTKLSRIPGVVREAIESQPNTRFDRCHFKSFADSSLDYEAVYHMLVPDYTAYMDVQQAVNLELVRRFREENIEFAFPTRTVLVTTTSGAGQATGP